MAVIAQSTISLASVKTVNDASQFALQKAGEAQVSAQNASEYASRALGNLSTVQSVTETLNWITSHGTMTLTTDTALDPTHVYFVRDNNGDYTVAGQKYAIVTEPTIDDISTYYELSINESLNNYVATHLALTNEGLWLIPESNGNKVLIATGSGSTYATAGTYIIGKENNTDVVLAQFASDGAQIGKTAGAHTTIDEDGMQIYSIDSNDNLVELANIGYGQGQGESGTAIAPYYTFGTRASGSAIGNYSHAEGYHATASGFTSHAEGHTTQATGSNSHAEGALTRATDLYSHAEGYSAEALAEASHAQNIGTIASVEAQTVIGRYNKKSSALYPTAFIIGNGTANNDRSDALTVDWSGNVDIAGEYRIGGAPIMASGHETFSSIATNSYADVTVTFNTAFNSAPHVVACLSTTGTAGNIGNVSVAVHSISKTGCTIRVFNNRGSALSPAVEWIAVGV